ncbi:hypothetical protein ES703_69760 [subsurface metagenome]
MKEPEPAASPPCRLRDPGRRNMTRITKNSWQPWRDEIKRFKARETQGLTKDMAALEAHIKKLREICPKDSAGYPHITALIYLNRLQMHLDGVKSYLAGVSG